MKMDNIEDFDFWTHLLSVEQLWQVIALWSTISDVDNRFQQIDRKTYAEFKKLSMPVLITVASHIFFRFRLEDAFKLWCMMLSSI